MLVFLAVWVAAATAINFAKAAERWRAARVRGASVPKSIRLVQPIWLRLGHVSEFAGLAAPVGAVAALVGFPGVGLGFVLTLTVFGGFLDDVAGSLAPFATPLILTGAGFSKPWGGYLASEIWNVIVSDRTIRDRIELDRVLHEDLNFEAVLAKLDEDRATFSDADRGVLRAAVDRAFELQETRIDEAQRTSNVWMVIEQIVHTFTGDRATSCFFTLNQDLLFERVASRLGGLELLVPGVSSVLPVGTRVNPFDAMAFRAIKGKRSYIKLHGSMNWQEPGGGVAVLGGAKEAAIERFDILRMNTRIFRKAVVQPGARLLVIGYGFGDPHINENIAIGAREGLKIWIVDPRSPDAILKQLLQVKASGLIWRAVIGHSSPPVADLFNPATIEHRFWRERFLDA